MPGPPALHPASSTREKRAAEWMAEKGLKREARAVWDLVRTLILTHLQEKAF